MFRAFALSCALLLCGLPQLTAAETLTVSFKTTSAGGSYSPHNIVAVWIQNSSGGFVKTIGDWSQTRRSNLVQWRSKAGTSDTDAIMGATRTNHTSTLTVSWDMLPRGGGSSVADGVYAVCFETVDSNGAATNHRTSFTFSKNGVASSGTIPSQGGYTNIVWTYAGRPVVTPVITSATTSTATVGAAFSYAITASNTPTSFGATGLPSGFSVNTTTGVISGTPAAAGTAHLTVSASNAGGTGSQAVTLTSVLPPAPVITSATSATATTGVAFTYTITASNTPTALAATGLPAGLTLNTATGAITGTVATATTASVALSATNPGGTGTATLTLAVHPPAPVITSASSASATVGTAFSYTITASNSPTAFTATGLPGGLSLAASTGIISGTPTTAGTFTVTLGASNTGGSGSAQLTLGIGSAAGSPAILSALTASAIVGQAFTYQIVADHAPTSYTASGLPAGLSLVAATGVISGTPSASGVSSVVIGARNAAGTGSATLMLTVRVPAPVITSPTTASAVVGTSFRYTIVASNSPTAFTASGLPAGLTLNAATGVISGTPSAAGNATVTLGASNGTGTGSASLALTVAVAPPVITSAGSTTGTVGEPFTFTLTATQSPTAFTAAGLPDGLALDPATGVISGTPTISGSSTVAVGASNAGGTGTANLTVVIADVPTPAQVPSACGLGSIYGLLLGVVWLVLQPRRSRPSPQ
jgi:hypothetical protein